MRMLKRLACAAVSVAMAATMLTGCNNGRYIMSYDDTDVNAGIYIYNIVSEMLNQQYMLYYKGSSGGVMDEKVNGKEMAVYLEENAMEKTKEYCAVTEKFKELDLELTDEDLKSIASSATNSYNSQKDMYEELGISKESIKLMLKESKMKEMIFDYYYGKDGKEAPSDDEVEKYVNENYVRFKTISISKSTKSDEDEKEKENKENKELADKYFKKAEGKNFKDFDEVIEEYEKYVEEKEKQESSGTDSSSSSSASDSSSSSSAADSSSSSSAADSSSSSSSAADSSSSSSAADSSSSKVGDTDSTSKTDSSSASDSSSNSDSSSESGSISEAASIADSSSDDSSTGETKEEDKYPHESMINYASYDEDTLATESGKMLTKIKEMKQGAAEQFENDDAYYIIIKGDVSERSKEYASENHDTILNEMFEKTFEKTIAGWAEDLNIKVDNKSVKRYSAKSLYNKYTDFVTKNNKSS